MAQMVVNTGALQILKAFFNNVWASGGKNLVLRLYVNNFTWASTSNAGSYTEAAGGGYAAITLTNGSWTCSLVSNIEQAAYALQTFTFTGALTTNPTVYGWLITDADGNVITGDALPSPFTPASNGDNIQITPVVQASHGTPIV